MRVVTPLRAARQESQLIKQAKATSQSLLCTLMVAQFSPKSSALTTASGADSGRAERLSVRCCYLWGNYGFC